MAHHLLILLFILSGLSASKKITTVSFVFVQRGKSITIPCLYDQEYENNVKFWCAGDYRNCQHDLRTDSRENTERVSISDDITERVFTVTMNNLQDSGGYCCGVETKDGGKDGVFLYLAVRSEPALYVDNQEITGYEGGSVTVDCYYRIPGVKKWCRIGGSCVEGNSGTIDGMSVQISDDVIKGIFRVTLSSLVMKNTGWYCCSEWDREMPVHITVHQKTTTRRTTTTTMATTTTPTMRWERVLYILLKAANALVYLTCSIVAAVKVQEFRRAGQTGDRRKAKEPDRNRVEFIELRE